MSNNIVIVAHAEFSQGILSSLELVAGPGRAVRCVSVSTTEGIPAIAGQIEESIDSLPSANATIVLTDIPGGSTTQAALLLLARRKDFYLLSGLNLPLLLQLALLDDLAPVVPGRPLSEGAVEVLRAAVDQSRQAIALINGAVDGACLDDDDSDEL